MRWIVKGNETVTLDERQLTNILFAEIARNPKPELEQLSSQLCRFLEKSEAIASMNAYDIAHTGAMLGYYYKVFLTKNQVEVTSDEQDSSTDGS